MQEPVELSPIVSLRTALLLMVGVILGALLAAMVAPYWIPGLAESLAGSSPKAYWYLSRASGLVGYVFLWLSVTLGLLITGKVSRIWPGGPAAFDVHQFVSLLGIAFALFHGFILLGDKYMSFTVLNILVPFSTTEYRPAWVGLGQVGLYLVVIIGFSFYMRQRIGPRRWRLLHYGSFAVYLLVFVHGLIAGTDTGAPAIVVLYAATGGVTYFFLVYRILTAVREQRRPHSVPRLSPER
ncbi:MAG: ferric reductase-like transmembrane domain-containing protein [Chloroflexi bacterium]|nr:ferric reductase-like transmembrane domain-containing protein [Chloroflexota bacterium]